MTSTTPQIKGPSEPDIDLGSGEGGVAEETRPVTDSDYRTGPMAVFDMARGQLLGPVVSNWPDRSNPGMQLEFYHRVPNCMEDDAITMAQIERNRQSQGFPYIFMLRARNARGDRIYSDSELDMIRTRFPPDELLRICREFEVQCDKVLSEVTLEELGN